LIDSEKIKSVANINIALNSVSGCISLWVVFMAFLGLITASRYDRDYELAWVVLMMFSFFLALSVLNYVAAKRLSEQIPWAKTVIWCTSCLWLLFFPIGTLVGLYSLWGMSQQAK
jgi:hypothetical protein